MYKYMCLNPIADIGLSKFGSGYEQVDNINDADGILVRSASMHDMELPDNLLAIARAGAGVNNIPLDECANRGIVVFNTPGANANGVKEMLIAGMVLASRDIIGGVNWVIENKDDPNIAKTTEKIKKNFAGTEISNKKLGIIGLGAIGVKVANVARHLGIEVYGYDPYLSVDNAWSLSRDVKHVINIEDIYRNCDYISIHVPLMEQTKNFLGKEAIDKMKQGVVIINLARDLLVDEEAILEGINNGKIHRYVSDFPNPTVAGQKGCIIIPHLGASTAESEDNCAVMAVKEMKNYLETGNIVNSVNYPDCDLGPFNSASRIAIFHKNVAKMITRFSTIIGETGNNIDNMVNKSSKDVAYTIMDLGTKAQKSTLDELSNVEGVFRIVVVK